MAKTLIQQSRAISSKLKATYHEIDGAGKSRVKRPFFSLNAADETAIVERITSAIDESLTQSR